MKTSFIINLLLLKYCDERKKDGTEQSLDIKPNKCGTLVYDVSGM